MWSSRASLHKCVACMRSSDRILEQIVPDASSADVSKRGAGHRAAKLYRGLVRQAAPKGQHQVPFPCACRGIQAFFLQCMVALLVASSKRRLEKS